MVTSVMSVCSYFLFMAVFILVCIVCEINEESFFRSLEYLNLVGYLMIEACNHFVIDFLFNILYLLLSLVCSSGLLGLKEEFYML